MMMNAISRLRMERQSLAERISEIDRIISQYEDVEQAAQRLLGASSEGSQRLDSAVSAAATPLVNSHATTRVKTPIDEFERAVIAILHEVGRPLDRAKLYDALTVRGIVIGDGDRNKELNALSARVYRMMQDGQLVNVRGQGYMLTPADDGEVGDKDDTEVGTPEPIIPPEHDNIVDDDVFG